MTDITSGTGKVTTDFGADDQGQSVILQADERILVAGFTGDDFSLVRYNTDGSLDTTFGTNGKLSTDINSGKDAAFSVARQSDGKIVVAGYSHNGSNNDFALVRYNTDGSLDTTFDSDGKLTTAIGLLDDAGASVIVQSDGKIVVAGAAQTVAGIYTANHFALARYNTDGSLDTTFDTDGKVTTYFSESAADFATSAVVQSDGKIVAAGVRGNGSALEGVLVRYNTDGSLDTTFDTDGKITGGSIFFDISDTFANSLTLQADGKIIVTGTGNSTIGLARFNTNGSVDTTFGIDGGITTDISSSAAGNCVTLQADGKILVAGSSFNGVNYSFALLRYNTDGSLDSTFGTDGKLTTDIGISASGQSVTVQTDGKILVAGSSHSGLNYDFALVRYNADGSLDTSFDSTPSTAATADDATIITSTHYDQSVTGGTDDDVLAPLDASINTNFSGGAGNDTITGGNADDYLGGGEGNDILNGGTGNNILDGGAGTDTAILAGVRSSYAVYIKQAATASETLLTITALSDTELIAIIDTAGRVNVGINLENVKFSGDDSTVAVTSSGLLQGAGTSGNDTYTGDATSNFFHGGAGNDVASGAAGADLLYGDEGKDTLNGGSGNDTLDGGSGTDTALLSGSRSSYTLTQTTSGWTISSTAEGVDTLSNVERLKFSDKTIGLDISGNAGQAYRVYQAAFDRTPDSAGLGYWVNYLDNGGSLTDVGGGFVGSAEFRTLYGASPANADLVSKFYLNVLHRAPEQAGYDYWLGLLNAGTVSTPSLLTLFSESPENQSNLIGIIGNGIEYTPFA
jgi:uncharacterized delta-60 repeat protein